MRLKFEVQCFDAGDVASFLVKAEAFLHAQTVRHAQILGLVTAAQGPRPPPGAVFAVATSGGEEPVAVVAWSPARISVSAGPEPAIRLLVSTLVQRGQAQMSVVKGPVQAVEWFADEVSQTQGKKAEVIEEALLYRCDALREDLKMPVCSLRQLTPDDLDRFCQVMEEEKGCANREQLFELLADPQFCEKWFLWCSENGAIVAKARYIEWNLACAGVQGVYTPTDSRGKGYATGVVYWMCKVLLEKYDVLVLYVEKENAPANRVYRKIGFTEVMESKMVRFVDA